MFTLPDMNVHNRRLIPTRLKNMNRELTPYLSGDRLDRRLIPTRLKNMNRELTPYLSGDRLDGVFVEFFRQ